MTALMGIATRLTLARLILVVPDDREAVARLASDGFAGGADAVMLEEHLADAIADGSADAALEAIRDAARATQGLTGYLGRPVRGAELAPDLLLLADDEAKPDRTRKLVGEWTRIGRRCNTDAEVDAALADGAVDFLLVGPGLDRVRHAAKVAPASDPASKPWFAFGGITVDSLEAVLRAGAMRIAVSRGINEASDPEEAARSLKNRLREAWNDDPRMEAVTASAFAPSPNLTFAPTKPVGPTDLVM